MMIKFFGTFMLWLEIGFVEMIHWPSEVPCMFNEDWEFEELNLGVLIFMHDFRTYESSMIFEP